MNIIISFQLCFLVISSKQVGPAPPPPGSGELSQGPAWQRLENRGQSDVTPGRPIRGFLAASTNGRLGEPWEWRWLPWTSWGRAEAWDLTWFRSWWDSQQYSHHSPPGRYHQHQAQSSDIAIRNTQRTPRHRSYPLVRLESCDYRELWISMSNLMIWRSCVPQGSWFGLDSKS